MRLTAFTTRRYGRISVARRAPWASVSSPAATFSLMSRMTEVKLNGLSYGTRPRAIPLGATTAAQEIEAQPRRRQVSLLGSLDHLAQDGLEVFLAQRGPLAPAARTRGRI